MTANNMMSYAPPAQGAMTEVRLLQQVLAVLRTTSMTVEQICSYYAIKHGKSVSEDMKLAGLEGGRTFLFSYLQDKADLFDLKGDRFRAKEPKAPPPWRKQAPPAKPAEEQAEVGGCEKPKQFPPAPVSDAKAK